MAIAKEQLRQIIRENDFKNAGDVYSLLKVDRLQFIYFSKYNARVLLE